MNKLSLGTITQTGSSITADFTAVTNQYSSDTLEIAFNLDQTYSGAVSAAMELLADDRSIKAVVPVIDKKVTLPGYVTQYSGILRIALAWMDGTQIATTDAVELEIIPSVDPAGSPPPAFEIWLIQLHTYMDIYLHDQVDPAMQLLLNQAQKAVDDADVAVKAVNEAVNEANNAVIAAQTATESATAAAGNANDKAQAAQKAADAANTAKSAADTAANAANDAATNANSKANEAQNAASAANASKQAADVSAEKADAAATNANGKATSAENAAKSATEAAVAANTAKESADTAATAANTAKQSADTAASNAQSVADDLIKKRDAGEFNGSPVQMQKNTTHLQWKLQNESAWKNLIALLDLIGATPQIKVGTVTTLAAGSSATVTISGTIDQPAINFGIPKGQDGKGSGDMLKADYDADGDGIVDLAKAVPWSGISGKPTTFAPSSHQHSIGDITNFPTSLPANGGNADTVGGHTVGINVPANAKFTDTIYTHPSYTQKDSGLYKVTVDATGHVSAVTPVTKGDITALGIPAQDTNTVYTHPTSAGNKHIPAGGEAGQILRWSSDGTAVWGADNNTTYSAFKAATSSKAGGTGLVPAPAAGKQATFLRGDGQWAVPYTHPTVSGYMHIPAGGSSGQILRWSANGKAVWGEDNDTTYGVATQSADGLMAATDKTKLDSLTDEHLIRNITLTAASFVANTDSYASFYGFCSDYTVDGMTETCKADYETEPGSDDIIERGNTMAGMIRFYASAQPSVDVVLNNVVWKELG